MDIEKAHDDGQLDFIKSLELPASALSASTRFIPLRNQDLKAVDSSEASAAVAGSSIVSFVGGLDPELKQDVLDSVLFAQLAADKKYPNEDAHRVERYKLYNEILSKCGWTTTNSSMHQVTGLKQKFTMDQVALEIIASVVGPNKAILEIVGLVFGVLAKSPKALSLFENETKGVNSGAFQILPCIGTSDGEVMMVKTCLQFNSSTRVTKVLFWEWSNTNVNLYAAANNTTLNRRQYGVVRNEIIRKLEASGKQFIEDIEI